MDNYTYKPGDRIQDRLGHWYDLLEIRPYSFAYRVQPLTPIGSPAELRPLGNPVWTYRSDFKPNN